MELTIKSAIAEAMRIEEENLSLFHDLLDFASLQSTQEFAQSLMAGSRKNLAELRTTDVKKALKSGISLSLSKFNNSHAPDTATNSKKNKPKYTAARKDKKILDATAMKISKTILLLSEFEEKAAHPEAKRVFNTLANSNLHLFKQIKSISVVNKKQR